MQKQEFDVVVIGGGPGGSTTSTLLAKRGYRVLLLEKLRFPRFHIGESLLPAAWEYWQELGVIPTLEAANFVVKQGINFGLPKASRDVTILTGEYPEYFVRPWTYHVERSRYDLIMLDYAREHGVDVRQGWRVKTPIFDGERMVGVNAVADNGDACKYWAPVTVDATGRDTLLSRRLGLRETDPRLKKVAYFDHFQGAVRRETDGTYMTDIHAIDGGWIWYIPLKDDVVSVGVVVDVGNGKHQRTIDERFNEGLAGNTRISRWVSDANRVLGTQVVSNISYSSQRFVGNGYLMVGDAAVFVDPIFSAGVTLALRSGSFAAEAIDAALRASDVSRERLESYEHRFRHPLDGITRLIHNWYDLLASKDPDNVFLRSQQIPKMRERLVVALSGGYDRQDMDELLSAKSS